MEAIVPPEVTAELTQILSNLVLGDNQIRSKCVYLSIPLLSYFTSYLAVPSAEKIVDDRLSQTPELYILALAQFSTQADTEVVSPYSNMLRSSYLRTLLENDTT